MIYDYKSPLWESQVFSENGYRKIRAGASPEKTGAPELPRERKRSLYIFLIELTHFAGGVIMYLPCRIASGIPTAGRLQGKGGYHHGPEKALTDAMNRQRPRRRRSSGRPRIHQQHERGADPCAYETSESS
jgi:hypothetical protein